MIIDPNGFKNLEKVPQGLPKTVNFKTLPRFLSDFSYDYPAGSQIYTSKINVMGRRPKHAKAESVMAAKKIADLAGEKPVLCLLPGPESQLMLQTFCEAGVKFDAVVPEFKNNLNSEFVRETLELCASRNINPTKVTIDIIDFFESGKFFEYAEKYQCRAPEICLHLWLLDQTDSVPVLSGSFALPMVHEGLVYWSGVPTDLHVPYFSYFEKNGRAGEPWFLMNSTEFAVSYLELKANQRFKKLEFKTSDKVDRQTVFVSACNEMGYMLTATVNPRTDFEILKNFYDDKFSTLNGDAFNSLFTLPLELRVAPAKSRRQMVPMSLFSGKPDAFVTKQFLLNCATLKTKLLGV